MVIVVAAAAALLLGGNSGEKATAESVSGSAPAAERRAPTTLETTEAARGAERKLVLPDHHHAVIWVRKGHEVELHAAPGGPAVATVGDETEFGSPTVFSVMETDGEWAGVPNSHTGNGALGWVRLDARDLNAGYTKQEIVVDLSDHTAQLLRAGEPVRSFLVTIGAPETATPTGSFAVTDTFRGELNEAYGCCAVAITAVQTNFDSGWLGGNRIAIHGTTGPLGVDASHGCVRAADRDVNALVNNVPPGAPVTIRQ